MKRTAMFAPGFRPFDLKVERLRFNVDEWLAYATGKVRFHRPGWESLTEYACLCAKGQEGMNTPAHVFESCKELMATT
jgi:hypothetical protein